MNVSTDIKWKKWYDRLIKTRQNRVKDSLVYYEKHHILPKSMGGSDNNDNLIWLTPREHFIAHLLLVKFTTGKARNSMWLALHMMTVISDDHKNNRYIPNSRTYHLIRSNLSNVFSTMNKGRIAWNRGISRPDSVKEAVSRANKGKKAWNSGKKRSPEDIQKMKDGWAARRAAGLKVKKRKVQSNEQAN